MLLEALVDLPVVLDSTVLVTVLEAEGADSVLLVA